MRSHLPLTILVGYFSRRSPWACSRTDAPLAQWAPRLNGLSKPGSWPTQMPLLTSAITVQPTEQWVQTDFLISIPAVAAWASAFFTIAPLKLVAAARPPTVRPERRRKVRLSIEPPVNWARAADRRGALAVPSV